MKTLVYVGAHVGGSLSQLVLKYDKVFAFEANPWFCDGLRKSFACVPHVTIVNAAIGEQHGGTIKFNISKNNGDSSSILTPNKENCLHDIISSELQIEVPAMNLGIFLKEQGIDQVTTYISDLQGYDFIVLSSLKGLIDSKSILEIQCEVGKEDKPFIYINPNPSTENIESNFNTLLGENYKKVATGWGTLTDGVFQEVPPTWAEWDIRWKLKSA